MFSQGTHHMCPMKTDSEFASLSPVDNLIDRGQSMISCREDWRKKIKHGPMHLLLVIGLVSCASTPPQPHASAKAGQPVRISDHWVKVRSNPPTYYPRGTPSDYPTDFQSGEWVHTGDENDTRYFLPLRGLSSERRTTLLHEALAARSPNMKNQIAREDATRVAKDCATALFYLSPPGWIVAMTQAPRNPEQRPSSSGWPSAGNVNINPSIGSINCPSLPGGCPVGGVGGR
jgi:hypothetical protein